MPLGQEPPLKEEASHCLKLLACCRDAVDAGRWERMAGLERDYMAAFGQLKNDMNSAGVSVPEECLPTMQRLEREQRHLVRLARCKQQVIRDQLGMLNDAGKHLQRVKRLSRSIAGM